MKQSGKSKKLNVVDYIIIAVLVAAVALVCVRLISKHNDTTPEVEEPSEPNMRFTVMVPEVDPDLAANIEASLDSDPMEVEDEEEPIDMTQIFNSNKYFAAHIVSHETKPDKDDTVALYFTIEAATEATNGVHLVGTQEVRIGKGYIVKTLGIEITGLVTSLENLK